MSRSTNLNEGNLEVFDLWKTLSASGKGGEASLSFAPQNTTSVNPEVRTTIAREYASEIANKIPVLRSSSSRELFTNGIARLAGLIKLALALFISNAKATTNFQTTGSAPFGNAFDPLGDPSTNGFDAPSYDELILVGVADQSAAPLEAEKW